MNLKHSYYKVSPAPFNKVDPFIPTSKSYANRLLILAAVYEKEITIRNLPESTDVLTMIECLKQVGLEITGDLNELIVKNSFPKCEEKTGDEIHLQTGDGGTTNRFLMGLVSIGKKKYCFHPTERITQRPVDQFIKELENLNINVNKEENAWISIRGPLQMKDEQVSIDCSKSTQFATALQLVVCPGHKKIIPTNMHSSAKYFDITNSLCSEFQNNKTDFSVPLDFSSFSYPLALAAVSGSLELTNFTGFDQFQADSEFINILKKMGTSVIEKEGYLKVEKKELKGIEIDCSGFPDLVPTLAFVSSYATGETIFKNIEVLRHKESDRIDEVLKILNAFNVQCSYDDSSDSMKILGRVNNSSAVDLETAKDHRMIMVAYLFMRMNSGGTVYHIEHTNKSYPNFFNSLE